MHCNSSFDFRLHSADYSDVRAVAKTTHQFNAGEFKSKAGVAGTDVDALATPDRLVQHHRDRCAERSSATEPSS